MKPGKGLRRKSGLSRSSAGLRPSDGLRRGKGPAGRSKPLRASRRRRPPEGPLSPEDYGRAVWRLDGGRSIFSGLPVPSGAIPHHPLPKQILRKRGLFQLVWDPRNGVLLTDAEHAAHESRSRTVPYERLPARCREFAEELGPWAVDRLRKAHPPERGARA